MLGFEQSNPFELIPVRVVAHDPSPFFKSVIVSAGVNKGVQPFMPVVGEYGVAGKVVQVMPDALPCAAAQGPAQPDEHHGAAKQGGQHSGNRKRQRFFRALPDA
jgi:hypothetical protein